MSKEHLQSIQNTIEELERLGFIDITDQVKPHYGSDYLYICTLESPDREPIYCRTLDDLLAVLEGAKPSLLSKQIWFCEKCRHLDLTYYRKNTSVQEAIASMGESHRRQSPNCLYGAGDLRVVNSAIIASREALKAESSIPDWAKGPIAKVLFEESPLGEG